MKFRFVFLSLCFINSLTSFVSSAEAEKEIYNNLHKSVNVESAKLVSLDSKNVLKVKKKKMKNNDQTKILQLGE